MINPECPVADVA